MVISEAHLFGVKYSQFFEVGMVILKKKFMEFFSVLVPSFRNLRIRAVGLDLQYKTANSYIFFEMQKLDLG